MEGYDFIWKEKKKGKRVKDISSCCIL